MGHLDPALITAHGGALVDRVADARLAAELAARALPAIVLDDRERADLELIAVGAYSPLTGFMGRADHERVVAEGRLAGGLPWTIPVTLAARDNIGPGDTAALRGRHGALAGVLEVSERYARDVDREARGVYGTDDPRHPGVARLRAEGDRLLAGEVTLVARAAPPFPRHHLEPRALRAAIAERGWRRVVAFQTRNPIHRAHEHLTKIALESCDGLVVQPLVGQTKGDDVPADVRMRSYEVLLASYYRPERTILATLPAAMRYAGPKEAIFHAIVRKNYGCTHFIVGRDHAGVGDHYAPYAAHEIFDAYAPEELGIVPLRMGRSFYCRRCAGMATDKSCPHGEDAHVTLSGTALRELLAAGRRPPEELVRPEVAAILLEEGWR